jgi:hypothetical protein
MRKFKLIRLKGRLEAHTWDSVSAAANNTKMAYDFVDSAAISNLVNNFWLDFDKKLNKSVIFASKRKYLLNNSNSSYNNSNNNSNNTHKISIITNSNAGDWFAAKTFGD